MSRAVMLRALEALETWRLLQPSTTACAFRDPAIKALCEELAQPEQEPVAWMYTSQWKGNERFITRYQTELKTYKADEVWPLYTSPPQRQPLADEEIDAIIKATDETWHSDLQSDEWANRFARAIEAKLNRGYGRKKETE